MTLRSFVAILAASLFTSCSSSVDSPITIDSGSMAPIVTGIRLTAETGQKMGTWGNPTDGPEPVGSSGRPRGLFALAPNPSVGTTPLRYRLEKRSTVRLWVVRARLAGAIGPDMESIIGAQVVAPRMIVVRTLDSGSAREAGDHVMEWDATDDTGRRVPEGFYRIFLSIDNTIYWRDLLLVDTYEDVRAILGID